MFVVNQYNLIHIIVNVNTTHINDQIYLRTTQVQRTIKDTLQVHNTVVTNHLMYHLCFVVYSVSIRIIHTEINVEPILLAVTEPSIYTVDVHIGNGWNNVQTDDALISQYCLFHYAYVAKCFANDNNRVNIVSKRIATIITVQEDVVTDVVEYNVMNLPISSQIIRNSKL